VGYSHLSRWLKPSWQEECSSFELRSSLGFTLPSSGQLCVVVIRERHSIHNIAQLLVAGKLLQSVIELLEMLTRTGLLVDLED
jgi:hypothetical protein